MHDAGPADILQKVPSASDLAPRDSAETLGWVRTVVRSYFMTAWQASGDARPRMARLGRPSAISALELGSFALPGDDWITGQRIGMLVKSGDLDRALALALDCRASDWWCAALIGLKLHEVGDIPASERAFDRALDRMPPELRCDWQGVLQDITDPRRIRLLPPMSCEEGEAASRQTWWLSNPLFMEPGNDRRTEHFARIVQHRLHNQQLALLPRSCRGRHRWSLLALGFPPHRWSVEAAFAAFDSAGGLSFVPHEDVSHDPFASMPEDWDPTPAHRQERYLLPRWDQLHPLPGQVAFFRRAEGVHVAAASGLAGHPLEDAPGLRMALALVRNPDEPPVLLDFARPGAPEFFATTLPAVPHVVSLEALGDDRSAARRRFGHRPPSPAPGGLALSDPLLFAWEGGVEEGVEETVEGVLPRMLGTTELEAGATVGVFWEIYGEDRDEGLDISLGVVPEESGLLRRLGERLRVVGRQDAIGFTWQEALGGAAITGRALRFDLSVLPPGSYALEIRARSAGGEQVTATRRIEIRQP